MISFFSVYSWLWIFISFCNLLQNVNSIYVLPFIVCFLVFSGLNIRWSVSVSSCVLLTIYVEKSFCINSCSCVTFLNLAIFSMKYWLISSKRACEIVGCIRKMISARPQDFSLVKHAQPSRLVQGLCWFLNSGDDIVRSISLVYIWRWYLTNFLYLSLEDLLNLSTVVSCEKN